MYIQKSFLINPIFKALTFTITLQALLALGYFGIKNSFPKSSALLFEKTFTAKTRPVIANGVNANDVNTKEVSFSGNDWKFKLSDLEEVATLNINPDLLKLKAESIVKAKTTTIVKHKVASGETLSSIWGRYANNSDGALLATAAFKSIKVSQNNIRANEIIEFQISPRGDVTGFKKLINDGDSLILRGNSERGYQARVIKANIIETEKHITAYIFSSLAATAYQQGVPYGIIDELVDIFGNKIDFRRQVHPGDSFSVVYSNREFENGKDLTPGPVKAASLKIGNKMFMAVRHLDSNGKASYYDQNGEALGAGFLRYPLQFTRISSVFSDNRFHPVLKIKRPHHGVDFAAPIGTPVRAIGPGTIEIAGWHGGGGKTVKIRHNDRYSTAYLHLSAISSGLRPGAFVERGQLIGKVGMTGLSTGPHLHFSLYDNNRYVDPMKSELPSISANGAIPVRYLNQQIQALKKAHNKIQLAKVGTEKKVQNLG